MLFFVNKIDFQIKLNFCLKYVYIYIYINDRILEKKRRIK